jgi:uncharacterized tellurite resistance protein B-like protein
MAPETPRSDLETALLTAIHDFFEERSGQPGGSPHESDAIDDRPLQFASAVLFVQTIAADREARHDEHQALTAVMARALHIGGEEAGHLIRLAEARIQTPLPKLLQLLNNRCSRVQRKRIVESMWRLAFSDAELAGHEEYFVRKVAQALELSTADLVETKILAREAFLDSGA